MKKHAMAAIAGTIAGAILTAQIAGPLIADEAVATFAQPEGEGELTFELVVTAEEFYADPQSFVDRVTDRLGLPRHPVSDTSPRNDAPSDPMDADVRAKLRVDLAADIAAVEELLGVSTGWS